VAYQVLGDGPRGIVFVPDWGTNLEVMWELPALARYLERLVSMGRLVCFDKRGTGVSDPVPLGATPTIEQWMDDIRVVMEDAGLESATIIGHGDGSPLATVFAATYPERTASLVLIDAYARRRRSWDYPCGMPQNVADLTQKKVIAEWGKGTLVEIGTPSISDDLDAVRWLGRYERLAMSPGEFAALYPMTFECDVRPVLSTIRVPTLVAHHRDNQYVFASNGRYLADNIPGAQYLELEGADHYFYAGENDVLFSRLETFMEESGPVVEDDRMLATILFTDIVNATELAARLGDREWHAVLQQHHQLVRKSLAQHRGREIDTAGDGFFASFDGPARAVRCALAIRDAVRPLGLEIRAGMHTGECQIMDNKVGGIAVHIGARIRDLADAGEVLVSQTVRDLVAGSGLAFAERGEHRLKGVEGSWHLFHAETPSEPRSGSRSAA